MQILRNLKHIFLISILCLTFVFWGIRLLWADFSESLQAFFIYRTGRNANFQDIIYKHSLTPGKDIAIITIDDATLNEYQASSDLKTLTLWKKIYIDLAKKLKIANVQWIGWDILFQNSDTEVDPITQATYEADFASILQETPSVIATEYQSQICDNELTHLYNSYGTTEYTGIIHFPNRSEINCRDALIQFILENRNSLNERDRSKYTPLLKYESVSQITTNDLIESLCTLDVNREYTTCPGSPRSVYKNVPWWFIWMNLNDGIYKKNIYRPLMLDMGESIIASWKTGNDGIMQKDERTIYTLPIAVYLRSGGKREDIQNLDLSNNRILNPYFWITRWAYNIYSLKDVLEMSDVNLIQSFNRKYIFIGESGTAIHDTFESPVTGENMVGVEGHAHFLDGILQKKLLKEAPSSIFFLYILLTIVTTSLYFFLPKFLTPFLMIASMIGVIWGWRYSYDQHRILVDIFPLFLAGGLLTYPITYIYKYFVIDRAKRELEVNFKHYIDPQVVKKISETGGTIELWWEHRELTILFSDIAGFTSISEKLKPTDLFLLMVSYLSRMTDILIAQWGTLDKYIGDAVMGFFWAPLSMQDHAIRACQTAIQMRKALPEFNKEMLERWMESIDFRVGIATGDVMVWNIGSKERFNYTVLGDTVNLASRLEWTGKEYNVHIIISERTRKLIGEIFHLRELDTIAVKGKNEWVCIYELLDISNTPLDISVYENYEHGLTQYRNGNYMEAWRIWEKYAEVDSPSRIMMERVVKILQWEIRVEKGIYHMTHK